ncbi:MAG: hypothetical protein Q9166_006720 [cf. Caloplaca sp. 2 TL-2023]
MVNFHKRLLNGALEGNTWQKLATCKVNPGVAAWPKGAQNQTRIGVRFDYECDVVVTEDKPDGSTISTTYHQYDVQPNAGDIPTTPKAFRDKHGTHATMAKALIKKDGTKEDVELGIKELIEALKTNNEAEKADKEADKANKPAESSKPKP